MTTPINAVRSFYDAVNRGDAPPSFGQLAPGMEWRDYRLHETDLFASSDKVVAMGLMTGVHATSGETIEAAYVHVWDMDAGNIVRLRQTIDKAPLVMAMV